jgi:DNA-binding XRE family transcriptional regulator
MLSKNLVRLRVHRKYKQKEVADHLHVHETTYGRCESGALVPTEEQQTQLAEFFNVPLEVLRSAGDITLHLTNAHGTQVGNGHNENHQINVVSEEFVKQLLETIHAQQLAVLKDVRSLVCSVVQTNERLAQFMEHMVKSDRSK